MSSSGLIYAVIVGAWAAYLVPMWLRRQDELNEARPTERFSTAIRLLSGRAAMERKASRNLDDDSADAAPAAAAASAPASARPRPDLRPNPPQQAQQPHPRPAPTAAPGPAGPAAAPSPAATPPASVPGPTREQAAPPATARPTGNVPAGHAPAGHTTPAGHAPAGHAPTGHTPAGAGRQSDPRRRAALLARRRRMVILLFAVFTAGMVAAAVGGVALLWLPAIPAVLFSLYIAHLRRQERRRFEVKLDRRRAAEAAQRVRERERERRRAAAVPATEAVAAPASARRPHDFAHPAEGTADGSGVHHVQALVEAADSDETDDSDESDGWSSGSRERAVDAEPWDPVPVPLPTYVTAPVASRGTGGPDRPAEAWSKDRSGTVPTTPAPAAPAPTPPPRKRPPATPLFDQYADDAPHPRAANE